MSGPNKLDYFVPFKPFKPNIQVFHSEVNSRPYLQTLEKKSFRTSFLQFLNKSSKFFHFFVLKRGSYQNVYNKSLLNKH
jgi:hypothetical protein